jgi:putative protein kinase ArgK-like GTPase of G3E family
MMIRSTIQSALVLSSIALLSLTGCNSPSKPVATEQPAQSPTMTASSATDATAPAGGGYPTLLSVVEKTQAAVDQKDFAKAKQEFDQFETAWQPVEDGIKEKSSKTYDDVEQDMEAVMKALNGEKAEEATAALKAMDAHIQSAS